jgi:phosphotransacetylase
MTLDAALSADAASVKGIAGKVPGHPDILLLPGLDAGNALYKAFSLQPGSLTAGIIAGLRVPVVLTSRSDSKLTRFLSLYMALSAAAGSGSMQGGKLL